MTSGAGARALGPIALRAEEAISRPFRFTVDVISKLASVDPDTVLGLPACVTLTSQDGFTRYFHGVMQSFSAIGQESLGGWRYRAELVPRFWFASQTSDCRVFAKMTALEILQQLFADNGVDQIILKPSAGLVREFTVQYNETDYDFAVRLMEEEGYFWFFTHSDRSHTLILADANSAFITADLSGMQVVPTIAAPDTLTSFSRTTVTTFGAFKLGDYDPLNPSTAIEGHEMTVLQTPGSRKRDVYRFPALTTVADIATKRARLRQEASEAAATLCEAVGTNPTLSAGTKFTITKDRLHDGADTIYVVRRIVHNVRAGSDIAGGGGDSYTNDLEAFPNATKWRDSLQDRRPNMAGIHTAVVLGGSEEDIHTDTYGRIKVRFFWDHAKTSTADNAIFIRVMQPWSGKTWGWQHLPRVGSEVAVAFVNGDPDCPIVVGSLYNAEQMPPFALPGQQTKSGFRSRSTAGGSTSDFNEWSFDDEKGKELVFVHAQKDFTEEVENDHSMHVMHDQTLKVDNVRSHSVTKTEYISIGDAQTVKVGNGRTTTISKADDVLTIASGHLATEVTMGNASMKVLTGNITTQASLGNISIKADVGAIAGEALQSIELKSGASSITINPSGVTIKGMVVKIEGTIMLDLKGTMTKVGGDAMLMVKGAIVMVN